MQLIKRISKKIRSLGLSGEIHDYIKKCNIISDKNRFEGKVFCIGANKTGTTSVERVLKIFGYNLASQPRAEMLTEEVLNQNKYDRLFRLCEIHDAFQDAPFSLGDVYKALDQRFPNSKFILTVRDSGEQWFNSLLRFHTKLFSSTSRPPTADDLKNSKYGYKGMTYDIYKVSFNYPHIPLYDKKQYIEMYEKRNDEIIQYFKGNRDKLLVLNVSEKGSFYGISRFLGVEVKRNAKFPHENKT